MINIHDYNMLQYQLGMLYEICSRLQAAFDSGKIIVTSDYCEMYQLMSLLRDILSKIDEIEPAIPPI